MWKRLQLGISDIRSAVEIYTIILAKVEGDFFYLENIPNYQSVKRSLQHIVYIATDRPVFAPAED